MPEAFCNCPRPANQIKRHGPGAHRINAVPLEFILEGRKCVSCATAYCMAAPA